MSTKQSTRTHLIVYFMLENNSFVQQLRIQYDVVRLWPIVIVFTFYFFLFFLSVFVSLFLILMHNGFYELFEWGNVLRKMNYIMLRRWWFYNDQISYRIISHVQVSIYCYRIEIPTSNLRWESKMVFVFLFVFLSWQCQIRFVRLMLVLR